MPGTVLLLAASPVGKGRLVDAASVLPVLAAVAPSVLSGTDTATVVELADPLEPQAVLTRLRAAAAATGPLTVFIAGQLQLDRRQRLPHLALARTTPATVRYTALPWHWLRDELRLRPEGATTLVADLHADPESWEQLRQRPLDSGRNVAVYGRIAPPPSRRTVAAPSYMKAVATILRSGHRPPLDQLHQHALARLADEEGGPGLVLTARQANGAEVPSPARQPFATDLVPAAVEQQSAAAGLVPTVRQPAVTCGVPAVRQPDATDLVPAAGQSAPGDLVPVPGQSVPPDLTSAASATAAVSTAAVSAGQPAPGDPAPAAGHSASADPAPAAGQSPAGLVPVARRPEAAEPHAAIAALVQSGRHGDADVLAARWEQAAVRAYGAASEHALHWTEVRADLAMFAGDAARSCRAWLTVAATRLAMGQTSDTPAVEAAVDRAHHQWGEIRDPEQARELGAVLAELRGRVPGRQQGALDHVRRQLRQLQTQG
ncbi:hypothetical protein RKE30_00515 [Streptomyces sp. Li-HN-5-11]|uniref:hypothetical protein n=1 Tax=Streptomyces sp. Li-HN-5-11 TaxID=3075432 RepID=UPI0028B035FE|nr:hypothetical protein [Streptomyces sp. Li-HN-5-11]WNM28993.1 hypothetical protein RKE30_00515 [Streptomyces sp. Li-HN-5-11]